MALCNITGVVYLPNGALAKSRTLTFRRIDAAVLATEDGVVLPDDVRTQTSKVGAVDVDLLTGNYFLHVEGGAIGRAAVPDAPTADFVDVVGLADVPEIPPFWYQEISDELAGLDQAVADAEAAAALADAAADVALSSASTIAIGPDSLNLIDPDGNVGASLSDYSLENAAYKIAQNAEGDVIFLDADGYIGWRFPGDGSAAQGNFGDTPEPPALASMTDGQGLHAWRAKIARIKALVTNITAKIVLTGDSWTEWRVIAGVPMSERLWSLYGQAGTGWLGMFADESGEQSQLLGNARLVRTGTWTRQDMVAGVSLSPDGYAFDTTGTTGVVTITDVRADRIRWYYLDGTGAFSYSLDGGSVVNVACGNTGAVMALDLSGLTPGDHDLTITHPTNASTMRHFGGYATLTQSAGGVEFSKCGNGGSTGGQWSTIAPGISSVIKSAMAPDMVIVILGTNDSRLGLDANQFEAGLRDLIASWRGANPDCGVLLVLPPESGQAIDSALYAAYHERIAEIAGDTADVDFLSVYDFWPGFNVSNAQGLWTNNLHPNLSGGNSIAGLTMKLIKVE